MIHLYLKREKNMIIVNIGLETPIKAISRYHGCLYIYIYKQCLISGSSKSEMLSNLYGI